MNPKLLSARIAIALILLIGIFVLVVALIVFHPTLAPDVKTIVAWTVGQMVILLGFAVHAIFSKNAEAQSPPVPTTPPSAAIQPGAPVP